jgi:serine phosphatase RsbU (regulator of sigma subunit)
MVLLVGGAIGFVRFREKQLVKEKEILELAVKQRTSQLEEQKEIVEQKNTDIMDNIYYARNIQLAILPSSEELNKTFAEHFLIFRPQNIVSGDLYWYYKSQNMVWVAAVDCTGHGVPGAFMSMMANDLLNQAVIEKEIEDPASVLTNINKSIRNVFREENLIIENQQGMDISLVKINIESGETLFAGAMRPIMAIIQNEIKEWEGDRASIGRYTEEDFPFVNHFIKLDKNDSIFLFSDGYCDQFGGPRGKKIMSTRFKQTLLENQNQPLAKVGTALEKSLVDWQGSLEQVDDILVIGLRVSPSKGN